MNTNQNDDSSSQPIKPVHTTNNQASITPGGKETAPLTIQGEVKDFVEPSPVEREPELSPDVEDSGVEVSAQVHKLKLSKQQIDVGLKASGNEVPISTNQQNPVLYKSMLDEIEKKASGPAGDSGTWFNKLKLFVLGQRRQH